MTFFTALVFALGVTLPNILLLCLGKVLRIKKTISHEFCSQASALVFQFGLTLLLFINLLGKPLDFSQQG
ncbi:hypothetical protein QGZ99_02190 [Kingella kingae]|uniref:Uncharacterized protein n=3 Tax=Kingella kingae TaxID=504 RepID=F5S7K8_KINKI|nr:hypothetical protein [Kingella kingae]EGK08990.1 hypothetical protein HMPREF0476_1191 [Kingella kingae ATCC 23330]MDK4533900.1 hypothetical protein [Kingella kingae]MDK4540291.1 hypothetical protein [Kingella kingae]MDK4552932.1 hypothetical protein [Kingella kingae]UOP02066.1 hypothetical protein LVJ79_05350 [Kingella kingae]